MGEMISYIDLVMPVEKQVLFAIGFDAEIKLNSSAHFFGTQLRTSNANKRRVAELNHQSAKSHDLTPTVQPAAPLAILTNQVRLDTEFSLMNILSYQGNLTQICLQSMSCPSAVHWPPT
jgi:hypothetical protein